MSQHRSEIIGCLPFVYNAHSAGFSWRKQVCHPKIVSIADPMATPTSKTVASQTTPAGVDLREAPICETKEGHSAELSKRVPIHSSLHPGALPPVKVVFAPTNLTALAPAMPAYHVGDDSWNR
jgi:hypothetical protein